MRKIIVISAHPDDEILGCGGTLLKYKNNGDELHWIIITSIFESSGFSQDRVEARKKEIEQIKKTIGFVSTHLLDFPTMSLNSESVNELIPKISNIFNQIQPQDIFVVNRSDAHSDHRYTFDAVMSCTKSFRFPCIQKILMYECISETEFAPALPENIFLPNYFVDISSYLSEKLELIKVYKSELGQHPFPRSIDNIEALAMYRGAIAGVTYAEAFQLIKLIEK